MDDYARYLKADNTPVTMPYRKHTWKGAIVANMTTEGETILVRWVASHPFDGDDFRCADTNRLYRNVNMKTIKVLGKLT